MVKCTECLSQRHLLTKIFAGCLTALSQIDTIDAYEKVDSINALLGNLRKLFEKTNEKKFVLVIEDADDLRQAGATLLAALARLGDLVGWTSFRPG